MLNHGSTTYKHIIQMTVRFITLSKSSLKYLQVTWVSIKGKRWEICYQPIYQITGISILMSSFLLDSCSPLLKYMLHYYSSTLIHSLPLGPYVAAVRMSTPIRAPRPNSCSSCLLLHWQTPNSTHVA